MKKLALAACLATLISAPALAGDVYVLGSIGRASLDLNKSDLDNALTSAGIGDLNSRVDKVDTAYKFQVGYQINPYVAVEGGYVNLGKATYTASFTGGTAKGDFKATGFNVAALGMYPVTQTISLFGKLGVIRSRVEENFSATGAGGVANASLSANQWKPYWGLGANLNVDKQLGLRLEFEQFPKLGDADTTGEGDVNVLSLGFTVKF